MLFGLLVLCAVLAVLAIATGQPQGIISLASGVMLGLGLGIAAVIQESKNRAE